MIKANQLSDFLSYKFTDGKGVTLNAIRNALVNSTNEHGIPAVLYDDKVKSGMIFNPLVEDCIILHHPEHKNDYYKLCFLIRNQGTMAFLYGYTYGTSKQIKKEAIIQSQKNDGRLNYAMSAALIGLTVNKRKVEEEQAYYSALRSIVDEIVG